MKFIQLFNYENPSVCLIFHVSHDSTFLSCFLYMFLSYPYSNKFMRNYLILFKYPKMAIHSKNNISTFVGEIMRSTRKYNYLRPSMAMYIILYMLFNASFVHTHSIDGENITHSHPFTGKHHTSNEASLIKIFNSSIGVSTSDILLPECNVGTFTPVNTLYRNFYFFFSFDLQSLRAPPALIF